ncbi:putative S-adenosyl-L-methionine-dependent methyltransferase [Dioscorea sansibarensis]
MKNKKEGKLSLENRYHWKLCDVNRGEDYIPCLDNEEAISKLIYYNVPNIMLALAKRHQNWMKVS